MQFPISVIVLILNSSIALKLALLIRFLDSRNNSILCLGMNILRGYRFIFILILQHAIIINAEIISLTLGATAVAGIGAFFGGYKYAKCKFYECCDDAWIPGGVARSRVKMFEPFLTIILELQNEVKSRLYGQHLAEDVVIRAVNAHITKKFVFIFFKK